MKRLPLVNPVLLKPCLRTIRGKIRIVFHLSSGNHRFVLRNLLEIRFVRPGRTVSRLNQRVPERVELVGHLAAPPQLRAGSQNPGCATVKCVKVDVLGEARECRSGQLLPGDRMGLCEPGKVDYIKCAVAAKVMVGLFDSALEPCASAALEEVIELAAGLHADL